MDRFRRRSKKEKPHKYAEREKSPLFITDVKTIKENLKIKEILRTVKMNSSMRIKAPKGSKVMQNKDFNDNEDIFEVDKNADGCIFTETTSATNSDVIVNCSHIEVNDETENSGDTKNEVVEITVSRKNSIKSNILNDTTLHESSSIPEPISDSTLISDETEQNLSVVPNVKIDFSLPGQCLHVKTRDRKLSLDQSMLSRRACLSQSELDLNSIGKSPLERKSSFFRKKMDSFLRNTTEMFKRQTSKNQSMQRRGSMSVSLQSLNENSTCNGDFGGELLHKHQEELQGSTSSLQSSLTPARSNSSLSISQSERTPDIMSETTSPAGSRPVLTNSQPIEVMTSDSAHSLNEAYIQESLLHSRAISMSSGLDSAHGKNRRKDRSNRVTWLASEGLTNYLRRIIQDEKSSEILASHSYQDFSTIPQNNHYGSNMDLKGRRLSYQRAVSGEDPRYHDSTLRRRHQIPENSVAVSELTACLAEFQRDGIPTLKGFQMAQIPEEVMAYLHLAQKTENLEEFYDWKQLSEFEETRQNTIRELVITEAGYIKHLFAIVEVFMATAHAVQDRGMMLDIDTARLFTNIPDVLNASLHFWDAAICPMLHDAMSNKTPFNTELMEPGFCRFNDLFLPYEKYMMEQTKALDYLRSLNGHPEFMAYLTWCHSQKACNRLQLSDIMVKPMQRLTKYSLILQRIIGHTENEPERTVLQSMDNFAKTFVTEVNRSIRQRDEIEKMEQLIASLEPYEPEFKDEDMERCFRIHSSLNLDAPMPNCNPHHYRTIIFEGDLRFRDNAKEFEARVYLLTDMLLVCKKLSTKGNHPTYKLTRPKYFVDKLIIYPKFARNARDLSSLVFVVNDEVGSPYTTFTLLDINKDSNTIKIWEQKLREGKLTYDYYVWLTRHPSREISEIDMDSSSEFAIGIPTAARQGQKTTSEDLNIEKAARERVAVTTHRSHGALTDFDFSQISMGTESFDGDPLSFATLGTRGHYGHYGRHPMKRNSTGGSSRNSRLSSFQHSMSGASHDDQQAGPSRYIYKAGTSVEHVIPSLNPDEGVTSITVNVVSDSETETMVQKQTSHSPIPSHSSHPPHSSHPSHPSNPPHPSHPPHSSHPSHPPHSSHPTHPSHPPHPSHSPHPPHLSHLPHMPPMLVLQQPSPHRSIPTPMPSRSPYVSRNTLRVQPQNVVMALVHSLPDLTFADHSPAPPRPHPSPAPQTASDKLYQSHQELLQRNRLSAQQYQHYLTPDHRGTSYPPPSPTRGALKRGLAFSYSLKNPPLSKMGHVYSQSQLHPDPGPSTSGMSKVVERASSVSPVPGPSTSSDIRPVTLRTPSPDIKPATSKPDKKLKSISSRHKSSSVSPSGPRKGEKEE